MTEPSCHALEDSAVIAAELSRVILGGHGARRPELRMDVCGHMARLAVGLRITQGDLVRQLVPALRNLADSVHRLMLEVPR